MADSKRQRRSAEQVIADLEAKIATIKARAERQKVKRDPALRHMSAALRSIEKALAETRDSTNRQALDEARSGLAALLALNGVAVKQGSGRAAGARNGRRGASRAADNGGEAVDVDTLADYLTKHPGSRSEEIASGLQIDTKALRPALQQLKADGRARTEGQARATRYFLAR